MKRLKLEKHRVKQIHHGLTPNQFPNVSPFTTCMHKDPVLHVSLSFDDSTPTTHRAHSTRVRKPHQITERPAMGQAPKKGVGLFFPKNQRVWNKRMGRDPTRQFDLWENQTHTNYIHGVGGPLIQIHTQIDYGSTYGHRPGPPWGCQQGENAPH